MSGLTYATFDGFEIITGDTQAKEGAIYFKNAGIGGHFKNGKIIHNGGQARPDGALHSNDEVNASEISFEMVEITAPAELSFTGPSADTLEYEFVNGIDNTLIN
jgi:hypothetical protein